MYRIVNNRTLLGHDAECHVPNTAMTASKIAGKLDLIYFNNIIELLIKIIGIIIEINFILPTRERGGAQQPCIAAPVNDFSWPFWPTRANHHALTNRAGCALSTDAWLLAWVCQKCRQYQLVMVRLLCHGESGSSMFCGCGVAIIQYTSCKVQRPNNTPTVLNFPPIYLDDKMVPRSQ
jgi:hypothetical protein